MSEACGDCRFWLETASGEGICRRFPAVPVSLPAAPFRDPEVVTVFPRMTHSGWCGEYVLASQRSARES